MKFLSFICFAITLLFMSSVAYATESSVATNFTDMLTQLLPESFLPWVTGGIAICAAVATILPAVTDSSSSIYKIFYNIIQFIGLNFGKAKNEQQQ